MKKAHTLLFALHLFVGIGALAGGLAAIVNPQDPLGVPHPFRGIVLAFTCF